MTLRFQKTRDSRGYIDDVIMPHGTRPPSAKPIIEGVGIVDLPVRQ